MINISHFPIASIVFKDFTRSFILSIPSVEFISVNVKAIFKPSGTAATRRVIPFRI